MLGVEFSVPVKDIVANCQENGLLLIGAGANVIRFVPPLIISKANVDEAIGIFAQVLKEKE